MSNIKTLIEREVLRRRTFAIISHPDAGKTTLTEKLLLYGGAIRQAGSVKSRKTNRYATSDWMEIEKQRGISVTSSVMQFEYNGNFINILDTPGHQDFSEDTYRTLIAADSAVMIIDAAKGVEAQTIKLFQVCKKRGIPIFTFVNKMDRASKSPFDLMDEIESVLNIYSYPVNWPIGIDGDFKGIYNRQKSQIEIFEGKDHGMSSVNSVKGRIGEKHFKDLIGEDYHSTLEDEIELLEHAGEKYDLEKISKGLLTPVFFGSAMNNFGVETFLEEFIKLAPTPLDKNSTAGLVSPFNDNFTGFVFKIQANMNPTHRDRIAFIRICSGKYEKGLQVYNYSLKKHIKLSQPQQFMAQDRTIVEQAYPGDIIGVFDPGIFNIGDTLSEKNKNLKFDDIPMFPSEYFARITPINSTKRKPFIKGITQLSQEGTIQIFKQINSGIDSLIAGVVGVLQFEILEHRLKNEYNVEIKLERIPFKIARWIVTNGVEFDHSNLKLSSSTIIAKDKNQNLVLIFENEWSQSWATDKNKNLVLKDTSL
ncbi:MAG: peptide chain release factor 3 [Clostridiales bacterium]